MNTVTRYQTHFLAISFLIHVLCFTFVSCTLCLSICVGQLEQKLLKTAKEKMEHLSRAFISRKSENFPSQGPHMRFLFIYNRASWINVLEYMCIFSPTGEGTPPDTRFIEDGVTELLKTRRVLKCSYPYGFFLQQGSTQKEIFELMQVSVLIYKAGTISEISDSVGPHPVPVSPSDRPGDGDPTERTEGRRRVLGSLDEDDPNILLAIQLSLQESRREQGLDGGQERGHERRSVTAGDLADVALHSLNIEDPPGARGSSFPTSLLDAPRPPNRTDSTSQPSILSSLPLPPPPPTLSAELLELGDSLMKLGNITTPYNMDTDPTYSHSALTDPYSDCSHRQDQNASTPHVLDHITITDPHHDSKEQSYCSSSVYSAEGEHTASCALDCTHNPSHPSLFNQDHDKADSSYQPGSSYTAEHPSTYALDHHPRSEPQPPVQLCLPSPELEPELLLSPVIPPGGPFTPSDPQSLEALDPTASAQLLDNIMAWFNNNINPQNNPPNLALIPSPPTTETDSSPDTHTEAQSDGTTAPVWQPLEGEPEAVDGGEAPKRSRPDSLELENRDVREEGVNTGCVSDLSLDEEHTHPRSHSQRRSSHTHTDPPTEREADIVLQLEGDRSPEEWEEQEHLV
ncbi:hypothetical protein XENOCAPTIV_020424 [Xenoophorus captivus]|uniref:Uncharacterized protein n=1 Tax=Xenoophorus captivus TaxID=1517983 RepID=A0ABV0QME6_9TELE